MDFIPYYNDTKYAFLFSHSIFIRFVFSLKFWWLKYSPKHSTDGDFWSQSEDTGHRLEEWSDSTESLQATVTTF